jgi:hypothetical protein
VAKKTKPRHERGTRLSQAQLQAYQVRKAATVAQRPVVATDDGGEEPEVSSYTHWGRLDEEYASIRSDLVRLLIITALMLVFIVVLAFVLA